MQGTYRSGEDPGSICNPESELRLRGRRTRRAKVINGMEIIVTTIIVNCRALKSVIGFLLHYLLSVWKKGTCIEALSQWRESQRWHRSVCEDDLSCRRKYNVWKGAYVGQIVETKSDQGRRWHHLVTRQYPCYGQVCSTAARQCSVYGPLQRSLILATL